MLGAERVLLATDCGVVRTVGECSSKKNNKNIVRARIGLCYHTEKVYGGTAITVKTIRAVGETVLLKKTLPFQERLVNFT